MRAMVRAGLVVRPCLALPLTSCLVVVAGATTPVAHTLVGCTSAEGPRGIRAGPQQHPGVLQCEGGPNCRKGHLRSVRHGQLVVRCPIGHKVDTFCD